MNLSAKGCKKWLNSWKSTKNHRFGKPFATFRTNYHAFAFRSTFQKKLQKVAQFVKKHEKLSIWRKLATFRANYHVLAFSWTLQKELAKSASFRGKSTRIHRFGQNYAPFWNKLPCLCISINFSGKGCRKCLISWKSTRNHRFRKHYATFQSNYHVFAFRWTFKEKVGKSGSFREKAREIMDLVRNINFSNKLPCFYVSMNFSANSCRNCLISWKSTKTHGFGQNYLTLSNKLPCFGVSMNFSAKGCRKWINSWKSTKNHRFGQNFATFRTNYHVFAFRWTFQKEVAKSASFREKARDIIDFTKTCNFSKKLPCVYVSMNFMAKTWKKTASFRKKARKLIDLAKTMQLFRTNYHVLAFRWTVEQNIAQSGSIREKARKTINLAKTIQLFEQTAMSFHFDELFRKKLQKVPHFVKKNEKPSISPKLCNFSNKVPCLCISMNSSGKSCKKCLISWKNTKNHRFGQNYGSFWTNYHVFAFRWTFQEKVAKSSSFCEKEQKPIDLAKTFNFSIKLPFHRIFINFSARSCKKFLIP